jgi:hypothetical protein
LNDAPVAGDDAASVHFESSGSGTAEKLWDDDFSGGWRSRWPLKWSEGDDQISYFEWDGETWLRVTYPEGKTGKGFKLQGKQTYHDRVYLEYKLRFDDDFDWVIGGKLPSLHGGFKIPTPGVSPNGEDSWLARFWWSADGKGSVVAHYPDETSRWGEPLERIGNFQFERGVIHTLGLEVVMNTPEQHDGIVRAWLDGVLVVERVDIRWRDIPELKIDGLDFGSIFGGSGDAWAPSKDEHIEFGDFRFYTNPPWRGSDSPSTTP